MSDKSESNKNYETVGDDDVLLFGQATFLVRKFKELSGSKLSEILGIPANGQYIRDWMRELKINQETGNRIKKESIVKLSKLVPRVGKKERFKSKLIKI